MLPERVGEVALVKVAAAQRDLRQRLIGAGPPPAGGPFTKLEHIPLPGRTGYNTAKLLVNYTSQVRGTSWHDLKQRFRSFCVTKAGT